MQGFLDQLERNLRRNSTHESGRCRCAASVAVVMRRDQEGLWVLFIKRAANPRDRWSAHVAFPGGRRAEGETCKQTAVRETFEEVGLDLSPFRCLGKLQTSHAGGSLRVAPYVFLQPEGEEVPALLLQQSEVQAARWFPLEFFLDNSYSDHLSHRTLKPPGSPAAWRFPIVSLPHFYENDDVDDADIAFPLWGFTLNVLRQVLLLGGDYQAVLAVLRPHKRSSMSKTAKIAAGAGALGLAALLYSKL